MKVITQGKLPEAATFITTCGNCKTVFEFTKDEAKYQGDGRNGAYLVIACPTCHKDCYREY